MSSAPFDSALVIERLLAQVTGLQQVRGAADFAAVTSLRDFRPPEAFVLTATERGRASPGNSRQPAVVKFAVVHAVRNYSYKRGAPAMADASPLIGATRDALIGWVPGVQGGRGCEWQEGRILNYDAGTLLWSDLYQTQHFIGSNA